MGSQGYKYYFKAHRQLDRKGWMDERQMVVEKGRKSQGGREGLGDVERGRERQREVEKGREMQGEVERGRRGREVERGRER